MEAVTGSTFLVKWLLGYREMYTKLLSMWLAHSTCQQTRVSVIHVNERLQQRVAP